MRRYVDLSCGCIECAGGTVAGDRRSGVVGTKGCANRARVPGQWLQSRYKNWAFLSEVVGHSLLGAPRAGPSRGCLVREEEPGRLRTILTSPWENRQPAWIES